MELELAPSDAPKTAAPQLLRFAHEGESVAPTEFRADLNSILDYSLFVEGVSRSGKTNLVRLVIEAMYGHAQLIIMDPEGEYSNMRSEERPFLVVGKGRDFAIVPDSTAVRSFMTTILEKRVSVIFDLSEYEDDETQLIIAAVCDTLVSLPESHPGYKLVIFEELQDCAPEGGGKGTAVKSVRRLSKRGLKRGVSILGSSQRVADVSKGVLTQLKSKAIGGTDNADAPRALQELGIAPRNRLWLAELQQGEFYVKGPAFSRHATKVKAPLALTSPPRRRRDEVVATPPTQAPAEIAALASALAESAAAAELTRQAELSEQAKRRARAEDPGSDDYGDAGVPRTDPADIENAVAAAVVKERARQEGKRVVIANATVAASARIREVVESLVETVSLLEAVQEEANESVTSLRERPGSSSRDEELSPTVQRVLDALARLEDTCGIREFVPPRAVAILAGLAPASSTTKTLLDAMVRDDLLESRPNGSLRTTLRGMGCAHPIEEDQPRKTLTQYHAWWRTCLSPVEARILAAMIDRRGEPIRPATIAELLAIAPTSTTTERAFHSLVSCGLLATNDAGQLYGTSLLFPKGLQ